MPVLEREPMKLEQVHLQVVERPVTVPVENILLATDFSLVSVKAGAYARAVAQHFGSSLEIVNVFSPSVVTDYGEAILTMTPAQMKEISEENLRDYARELRLDGIETRLVSAEDHVPSSALLDIAREHEADLIVTGTEAKVGLSRLILGSTAEQLLRLANCPVLTVGPRAKTPTDGPIEFKTIIYATDLSAEAAKAAVIAVAFAQDSAAHLYCCSVMSVDEEGPKTRAELQEDFVRRMKNLIPADAYDWCVPEFVVRYGEAASSLLDFAHQVQADLIVLGARRSSFWLTRVEGGLTPSLLAHAKCPVLTVS